jgi:hypothetical protein
VNAAENGAPPPPAQPVFVVPLRRRSCWNEKRFREVPANPREQQELREWKCKGMRYLLSLLSLSFDHRIWLEEGTTKTTDSPSFQDRSATTTFDANLQRLGRLRIYFLAQAVS